MQVVQDGGGEVERWRWGIEVKGDGYVLCAWDVGAEAGMREGEGRCLRSAGLVCFGGWVVDLGA